MSATGRGKAEMPRLLAAFFGVKILNYKLFTINFSLTSPPMLRLWCMAGAADVFLHYGHQGIQPFVKPLEAVIGLLL